MKSENQSLNTGSKGIVLWDGSCRLCELTQRILKEKDTHSSLKFKKLQDFGLPQGGSGEKKGFDTIYFLSKGGRRFTHARAVFEAMRDLPGIWGAVGRVFANRLFSFLGYPIYRLIARNRVRISHWLRISPDKRTRTWVNG